MATPGLNYDVLLALIPFLDNSTLVCYSVVCRSLTYPALKELWKHPVINHPNQLHCFIQQLYHSVQLTDSDNMNGRPYHEWSSSLTIAFDSFQPIPLFDLFQHLLSHHLPRLMELTLVHTFAVFSPTLRSYRTQSCVLEIPIADLPSQPLPLLLTSSSSNKHTLWQNIYFGSMTSLPLTRLFMTETCDILTDDHLCKIAMCCPLLDQVQLSGLFTDKGIIYLVDHCQGLKQLAFFLPSSFAQANTITQAAMDHLAVSCPLLSRLTCLGQTRIDPIRAESTFRSHCPLFIRCNF